jgi:tripartite-type tricarboxylate transporter receptor subunit TctC
MIRYIAPLGLMLAFGPLSASAADYPDKPIRMLVGFAPGGGTDTTARAPPATSPPTSPYRPTPMATPY